MWWKGRDLLAKQMVDKNTSRWERHDVLENLKKVHRGWIIMETKSRKDKVEDRLEPNHSKLLRPCKRVNFIPNEI